MQNIIKILLLSFTVLIFSNCKHNQSLQQFMVAHEDVENVYAFDISNNILKLNDEFQTEENKKVLSTIKKANVMAYRIKDNNNTTYKNDLESIREILSDDKYVPLMSMGKGSKGVKVYAIGEEDTIDELIVLGNDHETGWIIVRVLGNKMQPEKIMSLASNFDLEGSDLPIKELEDFIK